MKQKMKKMISTLREKARRTRIIRKTVGLGLAIVMVLETPSWSGLIKSVLAHEDKAGAGRCIYVDTSLIGADSDVMESGIGAYVYNREGGSYSDAPIIMEKVEGKRNIYQLVLDDYYTYVEFTKGSDLNTGTKTGALAIDWSLGSPCYMFNSEALSDGGHFYGLYSIYFDLNGAPDASAFADNGVGIYAYNSDEDSYTAVPVAMRASGKGEGVYEYSFDKPYDCIAFMGGYGTWNYEVATTPVYMDWSYSAPCFFLEQVNGQESTGTWRNIRYTVYFDASDIKDDEAFIENGVWLYAFNDSDDKLSENPVKMVASSVGSYIYEYTMERPYENLQFILGDSLEAEVSSEVLYNDWLTYAEPCYKMTLDRKEILKASPSPSMTPSASPSGSPSATPSMDPSASPSGSPSTTPSMTPSASPSGSPSATPSIIPTPSATPSIIPTTTPTIEPTADPTATPAPTPTEIPAGDPTGEPTTSPEPKETPTPEKTSTENEDNDADDTEDEDSSDPGDKIEANPTVPEEEEPNIGEPVEQTAEEARVTSRTAFTAGNMTVTYGTYEMPWVGASYEDGNEPANTVENEKKEATGEASTPENLPAADETADSTTSTGTNEATTTNGSDEKPTPAPATGGTSGGEQMPSATLEMISPSASATLIKTEDNPIETVEKPTVEASMSVVSSEPADIVLGLAKMMRARAVGGNVNTIYFDASNNASDHGWNAGNYWIYFISDSNTIYKMNPSTRVNHLNSSFTTGALYEIEVPDEATNLSGVIFLTQNDWPRVGTDYQAQTIDLKPEDENIANWGEYPCFRVTGESVGSNPTKKGAEFLGNLGPESQAGKEIYFYDMTSNVDTSKIVAKFDVGKDSACEGEKSDNGGYLIPDDYIDTNSKKQSYSTISFYLGEQQIGETYNLFNRASDGIKGVSYNADTMNTFYYGATEKADGTKISYWGAPLPESADIQAGQTLYFDKLYFKVPKAADGNSEASGDTDTGNTSETETGNTSETETVRAQFQIGNGELDSLDVDEQDRRTYIYKFKDDSAATSQTILTYIEKDGTKYHFLWNEFTLKNQDGTASEDENNLVTLEDEIAKVDGKYELGDWIYFDATFSKLSYENGASIPASDEGAVYFVATGPDGLYDHGVMTKAEKGSWKDVWKVNLRVNDGEKKYTQIRFFNYAETDLNKNNTVAESTEIFPIPTDLEDPCFYADTGDKAVYDGGRRGGYWGEAYTLRDAEKYKKTDVVNIAKESKAMDSKTLYMNATLYDYYTDYELNGNNRDDYKNANGASQRNWVTFRQFNQALSDYYEENHTQIPLYTGHFQPNHGGWSYQFNEIADKLKLYGYDDYGNFFYANTSTVNQDGSATPLRDGKYTWYYATQGLVNSTLQGNDVVLYGGSALEPHFNKDFITGNNSKNAVLGEVYENVSFPFKSRELEGRGAGVKYWVYDSNETSLELKEDSEQGYWLKSYENASRPSWSLNRSSDGKDQPSTYGFFPFNEGSDSGFSSTYNYGYGIKLEFKFRLTKDGTVTTTDDKEVPIVFEFSGDDDVWVFIDGNLALDIGGPHGAVSGEIDFSGAQKEKTSVVHGVKPNNDNKTSTFEIKGANTDEHTFTMYYMERGMWESNMKITFNFPDENQLAVEKKVDVSGVNPAFQGLFQDASLFSFEIKNQATHYEAYTPEEAPAQSVATVFNDSFAAGTTGKDSDANTFEGGTFGGRENVVHWKAKYDEPGGGYKDKRCGIIYPSTGKEMDLSDTNRYLQFDVYYDNDGIPALNHMYIELVDSTGTKISRTLNGVTYGNVELKRRVWTTITVDLDKFAKGSTGFLWDKVAAVRFGYNYERDIYLDNFIFKSSSKVSTQTGFITKQYMIPDYGSVASEGLVYPNGAAYTLTARDGSVSWGMIESDGKFALADGESALFRDQFRRGSYIMLREITDQEVFDTSWTMYENGQAVKSMGGGDTVENSTNEGLTGKVGYFVDDGRKEVYIGQDEKGNPITGTDGKVLANNGYTETRRPDEPVFVFRSYAEPDYEIGMTKLKVVYTNTVKTGNLTIYKEKTGDSETLTGTYTFNVTFANVAGMGLEDKPITMTFTLKQGEHRTIRDIPINTEFTITETQSDKSFLKRVEGNCLTFEPNTKEVTGQITKDNTDAKVYFYNMLKPVIDIDVEKKWQNADGSDVADADLPDYLLIRLQRRAPGTEKWEDVPINGQTTSEQTSEGETTEGETTEGETTEGETTEGETTEGQTSGEQVKYDIKIGNNMERTWKYSFTDLDKYIEENGKRTDRLWEYRVVEVQEQKDANGNVTDTTVIANGGIWNNEFQVTFKENKTSKNTVSGDPDISADSEEKYESTITNVHTVSLKVTKVNASGQPLGGVSFRLERKNGDSWETVKILKTNAVTESVTEEDSLTTQSEEENPYGGAGIIIFSNLPRGEYRLIETETAPGYTLLASPIPITINTDGEGTYTINGKEQTPVNNTIELTIKNGQNLVMPATGGAGPIPFTVGGLSICMIAGLMYIDSMRKRRKEGKAS